jgi:hypothetical protein
MMTLEEDDEKLLHLSNLVRRLTRELIHLQVEP